MRVHLTHALSPEPILRRFTRLVHIAIVSRVSTQSLGAPILGDALYAHAADAAEEARAHLHAAALRLRLGGPGSGGELVEVRCPPPFEGEFASDEFRAWYDQVFCAALGDEPDGDAPGEWFAGNKQLSAKPP